MRTTQVGDALTESQWALFQEQGYLHLGKQLSDDAVEQFNCYLDDFMMGRAKVDYGKFYMQLDSATGYFDNAGESTLGFKKPTLNYRKIVGLEQDPLFLAYMRRPLFGDICARTYGPDVPIAVYHAMVMNKSPQKGTVLPYHQDYFSNLDRDARVTIWTAIDPATIANGCVKVIPGSHRNGPINRGGSSFLNVEQLAKLAPDDKAVYLELGAGEAVLLHNNTLHASELNKSDRSRRGLSFCCIDARTVNSVNPHEMPVVFGPGAPTAEQVGA